MKIGQTYRTARPYSSAPKIIDGLENYFAETAYLNYPMATLDKGINPLQKIRAIDGERRPAILLRSSPHKYEAEETPWADVMTSDSGNIIFFGDNKKPNLKAIEAKGNSALIEQLALQSRENKYDRNLAAPILLFESISRNGINKGQVKFCGLIRLLSLEKIIQLNPRTNESFENFKFNFFLMDLVAENNDFNWGWINDRRNPNLNHEESNKLAPKSWIKFLD